MLDHRQKTWSSVELFALYVDEGGSSMCLKTLFGKLNEFHGENVLILSSPGFANIMGFRSELTQSLHLVKQTDDDLEYCVDRVASAMTNECLALKMKRTMYHINIDKELVRESVGDTTALLLSKISSKFDKDSLAMMLVGNIITGTVCSQPTDLQVALGVLMRRNKVLISELSKYSVCCSYDEVRLFRYSAAVHVTHNYDEVGFGMAGSNVIKHCIYDNFDAEISSPNCKTCVHCLAMIMAEVRPPGTVSHGDVAPKRKTIKRQPMQDRSKPVEYNVQLETYNGPKKPLMPQEEAVHHIPSLSLLASQTITKQRAMDNDFAFLQDIHTDSKCPEYNGYNTRLCRQAGILPQPHTEVAFVPLIDRPPAHHDTTKTAINRGLSLARTAGEDVLVLTADQQLYKVTIDILFHEPFYFKSVIPVLGGMHMLMNFIHATAVIMSGSGMKEILAGTFGSVEKMLSGKKYPQNFRALRMLVEELLRDVVLMPEVTSFTRLIEVLEARASCSRTTKMWTDNLVKTVIIMMNFSRAGHEGDWALHLVAAEAMLPYFRSAGCHNYARYGAFYVHQMKGLNSEMMKKLQQGAFVRHIPGIYNSTWTDMFIETTYMRLGHGPAGTTGMATDYHQMVKWALSFALTGEVSQHVLAMSNSEQHTLHTHHKEETKGRIKVDKADCLSLRNTLGVCVNPLDDNSHPDGVLMNIVSGQIAHPDVNADEAVSLGQRAMNSFKAGWPESFYDPLGKLVVTMDVKKKHVLIGQVRVYDQELIYARVIGLRASSREINFDDVLEFELAAHPPSMFNPEGDMKISKSKSTLKQKLQVAISERNCPIPDTVIYDVSALLWTLTWTSDKLQVFVDGFLLYVHEALQNSNVTLAFDRYFPNSTKNFTRTQRAGSSRVHKLTLDMPTPARQIILTNQKNKIQLNAMLVDGLLNSDYYTNATQNYTLTIAGVSDVPVEIVGGVRIDRQDLRSTHEEADIIIAQHAISSALLDKSVRVVCEDTDVFVLLVHFYHIKCIGNNPSPMIMSPLVKERTVIDIGATAAAHSDIADDLLAIHGISGADTVASLHGVGKVTAINIAKKGTLSLSKVGDVKADMKSVQAQATQFICAAYGKVAESCTSMTGCRIKMWHFKTGKKGASSVKLCSIPPTTAAFIENVNRCHLQVATWKAALEESPPTMDPTSHGWELDHQGILIPRTVPAGTLSAPADILKLIRCSCKTSECLTAACSCSRVGCTVFCLCEGGEACKNPLTLNQLEEESVESDEDTDDN